jgi:WD40 repeat protein
MARNALIRRLVAGVAGYDVFVSYSRQDGAAYARAGADALETHGLVVCLDLSDFEPGDSLSRTMTARVQRSRRLLLIDTPGARRSRYVGDEIARAHAAGRPVVRVSDGSTAGLPWQHTDPDRTRGGDPIWLDEPAGTIARGIPSPSVVVAVARTTSTLRAMRRVQLAALLLALGVGSVVGVLWQQSRSQRLAAQSERQLAINPAEALSVAIAAAEAWPTDEARRALGRALDQQNLAITIQEDGNVEYARFASDESYIVAMLEDGTRTIWNLATGAARLRLPSEGRTGDSLWRDGSGRSLARDLVDLCRAHGARFPNMSPDCTRMVFPVSNESSEIWDLEAGRRLFGVAGHTWERTGDAYSPDGRAIVTVGTAGRMLVWDASTGRALRTLECDSGYVNGFTHSRDSKRLATAGDDAACVWEIATPRVLARVAADTNQVSAAGFSPDGTRLVTASKDALARIWDLSNGTLVRTLSGHESHLTHAEFSPDGTRVLTASTDYVIKPPGAEDGQRLSTDHTARLWNIDTGTELGALGRYENRVGYAAFSADGSRIVTAGDSSIQVHGTPGRSSGPLAAAAPIALHLAPDESPDRFESIDGLTIHSRRTGGIRLTLEPIAGDDLVKSAFSADGRMVVGVFRHGLRTWDAQTGTTIRDISYDGIDEVGHVAIAPSGRRVAIGHDHEQTQVLDLDTGAPLDLEGMPGGWSADSQRLATVYATGLTAIVWDVSNGQREHELTQPSGFADAAFAAAGRRLVTTGNDGWIRVWELDSGAEFDAFHVEGGRAAFTTAGDVAIGGMVYPLSVEGLLQAARARVPRLLRPR